MYFLTLFLFSLLLLPNVSFASGDIQCSPKGYTVATINGVFTDDAGAKENKEALRKKFLPYYNGEPLTFEYFLNPSHLGGIGDIMESAYQKYFDESTVRDYDLIEILKAASEKVRTQKLLLIAHSQGNFYSNSFYGTVADESGGIPKQSIGTYAVATPSGRVAGGGKWLTSDTDEVIAGWVAKFPFRNIMRPNTHIVLQPGDDAHGHSFTDVYLKYRRNEIVSDIQTSLDALRENSIQNAQTPCIAAPKITIAHKVEGLALAVGDPTFGVIVPAVKTTAMGTYYAAVTVGNGIAVAGEIAYNGASAAASAAQQWFSNIPFSQIGNSIAGSIRGDLAIIGGYFGNSQFADGVPAADGGAQGNTVSEQSAVPDSGIPREVPQGQILGAIAESGQIVPQPSAPPPPQYSDISIPRNVGAPSPSQNTDSSSSQSVNSGAGETAHGGGAASGQSSSDGSGGNGSGGGGGNGGVSAADQPQAVRALQPAKILISEIQITGGTGKTENDFIELYNSNDAEVNLKGYRLVKRIKAGSGDTNIKSWTADAFIPARGYYLWANSGYADIPVSPDTTTSATIANDNGVAVRFGSENTGTVVDSVGWGEAQNIFAEASVFPANPPANQSIQRKFQDAAFVDTDNNASDFELRACPSPKAQSRICGQGQTGSSTAPAANQTPTAAFVASPSGPRAGDAVAFDAASSSDPDGTIASYQWNFGDGSSVATTTAAATHSYSTPGNYSVQLVIFDNQSASSTATSTILVDSRSGAGHVVISEVQVAGVDGGDEFIELYNPTSQPVDLSPWSLQYVSGKATSTSQVEKKNFESGSTIPARGFFLIARAPNSSQADGYRGSRAADMSHRTFALSGEETGATVFLVDNHEVVSGTDDKNIIDRVGYGSGGGLFAESSPAPVPAANASIERKAFLSESCVSARDAAEFSGNGCDTDDNRADFDVRSTARPQNSDNLPEPRAVPTMNDFRVVYDFAPRFDVSWSPSADASGATSTNAYALYDASNQNSPLLLFEATSTNSAGSSSATPAFSYRYPIDEIGRTYTFELQAKDRDGLAAKLASTVSAKSFLDAFYFYRDNRPNRSDYVFDITATSSRPFWKSTSTAMNWRAIVFYLNKDAPRGPDINGSDQFVPQNTGWVPVDYSSCGGGTRKQPELIFPEDGLSCGPGPLMSLAYVFNNLEDQRFTVTLSSSTSDISLSPNDYATLAFYDFGGSRAGNQWFTLAAVDKTKYHFQTSSIQAAPTTPGNFSANFSNVSGKLNLSWSSSTDADTLDWALVYQMNISTSSVFDDAAWESLGQNVFSKFILPTYPNSYRIGIRAMDDWGNVSAPATLDWNFPAGFVFLPSQLEHDSVLGYTGGGQQVFVSNAATIAGVALFTAPDGGGSNSQSYVEIRKDKNGTMFGEFVATSTARTLARYEEPGEHVYTFDPPVRLEASSTYWIIPSLGPAENANETRIYGSRLDLYADGFWSVRRGMDAYFRFIQQ